LSPADHSHPDGLNDIRKLLADVGRAALALAKGQAIADAGADGALADFGAHLPAPLRAMRTASLLVPVAALWLLGIHFFAWSLFSFTRADALRLSAVLAGGIVLATVAYSRPRVTITAFLSLWNLKPLAVFAYLALLFLPPAFFQAIFLKRLFCGIILLPFVAAMWMMYRETVQHSWIARGFPLVFAVMAAVPGFILPPYYQGIAGWTTIIEDTDRVTLAGYQLVNDKGERIWITHTIFSPVTQVGRFDFAWYFKKDLIGPIEPFIFKAYQRAYPWLKDGYMSNQRFLGRFAYPPSTYAVNLPDHSEFPPERIRNVQMVYMIYDRQNNLVDTQIYGDYEVPRP
jgi:hypothetical protein